MEEKNPKPVSTTFAERCDLFKRAALLGLNSVAEKPADPPATPAKKPLWEPA